MAKSTTKTAAENSVEVDEERITPGADALPAPEEKKEPIKATAAAPTTEATAPQDVKKMVGGMKAKLNARPKVSVKIPIDKMNPNDLTVTVQINGYTYTIKRGEEVKVPDVVKKLLERGDYI